MDTKGIPPAPPPLNIKRIYVNGSSSEKKTTTELSILRFYSHAKNGDVENLLFGNPLKKEYSNVLFPHECSQMKLYRTY